MRVGCVALPLAALIAVAAHAAEPPPFDGWTAAIESGTRGVTAVTVSNRCHAAHRFTVEIGEGAERWLRFDERSEVLLAPGTSLPLPATVDATLLDPGQHAGALTLRCLDCQHEPGCTARRMPARLVARWPLHVLADTAQFAADSLLVLPAGDAQGMAAFAAEHGLRQRRPVPLAGLGETWAEMELLLPQSIEDLIGRTESDPRIRALQPNFLFHTAAADPLQPLQHALPQMRLDPSRRNGGRGVTLAVVDSGIDIAHPDLVHAAWTLHDAVGDGLRAEPHGTLVAGLIAAQAGNGVGIAGIAPHARLLAVRACLTRDIEQAAALCTSASVALGVDWSLAQQARVINLSFTGPRDPLLLRLLRQALSRRVVVVAAAGNNGPNGPPLYPAAEPGVIAVTAVDAAGRPYAHGATGRHVELAAPGVEVLSTWPGADYRAASGTSFAAAQVSALAALFLAARPELSPAQVKQAFGAGVVDACRMLGEPC